MKKMLWYPILIITITGNACHTKLTEVSSENLQSVQKNHFRNDTEIDFSLPHEKISQQLTLRDITDKTISARSVSASSLKESRDITCKLTLPHFFSDNKKLIRKFTLPNPDQTTVSVSHSNPQNTVHDFQVLDLKTQ